MKTFQGLGQKLWDGWMWFAHKVGWVNEHLLLGFVYWLFIGVYAVFYDLCTLFRSKKTTMWRPFEHQPKTLEDLEQQF